MTRSSQGGSTIIEVLAAVAIFGIVAAGATTGTIATIHGASASRMTSAAAALIHDRFERLRALDPAASPADLTAGAHADAQNPLTELGAPGGGYTRTWIVTRDTPRRGMADVRITVTWTHGGPRSLTGASYVCLSATCS